MLRQGDVDELNRLKKTLSDGPGQMIFHQGDPCNGIYLVEKGTVAVRKADEHGNTVLVRMRHRGDAVGYRDFFLDDLYTVSAETLVPSPICCVDRASVGHLLKRNPAMGLQFMQSFGRDLYSAEDTILRTASFPIRKRLAHLLLTLKDRYTTAAGNGVLTIELPLSRQDIASILGARRETIARAIHDPEENEIANFSGHTEVVQDLDLLLDEVEPAAEL